MRNRTERGPVAGEGPLAGCIRPLLLSCVLSTAFATGAPLAALPLLPALDVTETPSETPFVPDEVIVKFKTPPTEFSGLSADLATPLAPAEQGSLTSGGERILKLTDLVEEEIVTPNAAQADRIKATVAALNAREDVAYAQLNWIWQHFAVTPDDPGYPQQWHFFARGSGDTEAPGGIGLPTRWGQTTGSLAVTVAVIDTGILPDHPDIAGSPNLGPGFDMISMPFIANDGDGRDDDPTDPGDASEAGECGFGTPARGDSWHGTHVAGTVGVVRTNNAEGVAGVAWQVQILPVRVLGKCGGTTSDINDAIRWAAGLPVPDVPANPNPAKVISLSLGGRGACSQSPSTQAAIDDAVAQGATVVVAAGNDAADAAGYTPAGCDNVVTVAASDLRGHLVARYSNFGDAIEIMAPGGDLARDDNGDGTEDGVLSSVQGGYALYNGTSMAAPHVAGVVALMLAEEPALTPQEVLGRLQETAVPRSDEECPQPCGAGLLQAVKSDVPADFRLTLNLTSVDLEQGDTASLEASVTKNGSPAPGIEVHLLSQDDKVVTVTPASALTDEAGRVSATLEAIAVGGPVCVDVGTDGEDLCVRVTVVPAPTPTPGISLASLAILIACLLVWVGWRHRRPSARHGTSA